MKDLDVSRLDSMTEAEEEQFFEEFERALASDTGEAARSHLTAGRPIYFHDNRFPDGVIKEYPDGRHQLVTFRGGQEVVMQDDLQL